MNLFLLGFCLFLSGKTSAKVVDMPAMSGFTQSAGIELMEIIEITNQADYVVCAQQCAAQAECTAYEFVLPKHLCVLASEYRTLEGLAKGASEALSLVFVKDRGLQPSTARQ